MPTVSRTVATFPLNSRSVSLTSGWRVRSGDGLVCVVGLFSRLARAVLSRAENSPKVQAQIQEGIQRGRITGLAMSAAYSTLDDQQPAGALRRRLEGQETQTLDGAAEMLNRRCDSYVGDRAYRLLTAAAAD
jgi:hypothetical protein